MMGLVKCHTSISKTVIYICVDKIEAVYEQDNDPPGTCIHLASGDYWDVQENITQVLTKINLARSVQT